MSVFGQGKNNWVLEKESRTRRTDQGSVGRDGTSASDFKSSFGGLARIKILPECAALNFARFREFSRHWPDTARGYLINTISYFDGVPRKFRSSWSMETCLCNGFRDDPDIFSKLNSAYKLKRREFNAVLSKSSENDENVKIFMKMLEKKLTEKYYQVWVLDFLRLLTSFMRRHWPYRR